MRWIFNLGFVFSLAAIFGTAGCDHSSSQPKAITEKRPIGVILNSWSPKNYPDPTPYLDKVAALGVTQIAFVPSYFIRNYDDGIRGYDTETATLAQQKGTLKAMLDRGFTVNYRPHVDPYVLSSNPDAHNYPDDDPGAKYWRGNFNKLDPMGENYRYHYILPALRMLADAITELKAEKPDLNIPAVRFDVGAELMDSIVNYSNNWADLVQVLRAELVENYPAAVSHIKLSYNFCHHVQYLRQLPNHEEFLKRLHPDRNIVEADLYLSRMTDDAKLGMARFIRSLDVITLSQYMPLDQRTSGNQITKESVRDAFLAHEASFFTNILVGQIGLNQKEIPEFHIGEVGVGILGLYAPNVWNRNDWQGSQFLLGDTAQKRDTELAMQGLTLYLKDPRTKAKSAMLWLGGAPYDFFNLTAGMPEIYNPGAVKAIVDYLKS